MCGICGKLSLSLSRAVERSEIEAMCGAIHHRGPDSQGVYVKGPVGLGSAAYASEKGDLLIIGVDVDQYVSNEQDKGVYLTSVEKGIDAAVYDTIKNIVDTGKAGDPYVGTLENGGVDIAEFHDHDADVPQELKDELKQLKQDIIDGKVDTSKGS